MALIDCEGFGFSSAYSDFTTYAGWTTFAGVPVILASGSPWGGNAVQIQSSHSCGKALPSAGATSLIVGLAVTVTSSGSNSYGALVFVDSANNCQTAVTLNGANGQLVATAGMSSFAVDSNMTGGTILGSSHPGKFAAGTSFYLEAQIVIAAASGGSITIRVNGATVLSLAGVTTQGTANVGASYIGLKGPGNANPAYSHYSDIYVCDTSGSAPWNTFLGVQRVQSVNPTANDAVQFTPTGQASNYLNAAEYPPVPGTDYNSSSTVGAQDTFTHGSVTNLSAVSGVVCKSLLFNPAANGETMANVLLSSTSSAQGATRTPGAGGLLYTDVMETDPATSAAWTVAAAGACRNGYKLLT